jgi:peptidoglycan/xylan/chitin deacetylase (PgdA/CDA1 family)
MMSMKSTLLNAVRAGGLATVAERASAASLRILGYHGVWITPGYQFGDCAFITPDQFEARMARLSRSGLPVLPLDEAVNLLATDSLPDNSVVITIDDGWATTHTHMLPVLEAYGLPATLYASTWYCEHQLPVVNVVVDYLTRAAGRDDAERVIAAARIEALPVDDRLPALRALGATLGIDEAWLELRQFHNMTAADLADAHARGLDIQLHTHRHIDVATRVDELPAEIAANRAYLAKAIGTDPGFAHFCYPGGGYHPDADQLLAAVGVRSATLIEEGINPPGTNPYALCRLLDGRTIDDAVFDAYLSGTLHYLSALRTLPFPSR